MELLSALEMAAENQKAVQMFDGLQLLAAAQGITPVKISVPPFLCQNQGKGGGNRDWQGVMKGIRIEDRKLRIAFVGAQREAGKPARILMAIRGTAALSDSFPPGFLE